MSEKCKWGMYSRFDDGVWGTSCGAEWEFTYGGTVEEHGMKYCPFCGRAIEEVPNQHNLSAFERQIIQHLPEEVEWISRNQDGVLNIHSNEPEYKFYGVWMSDGEYDLPLKDLFKHVKWEVPWNFREEAE
ncbi:hypothetical protein [Trichococcus collinsii]|uniref:Uncharacterized protein n=1 Tax=Trichococcus collinsii TaxID=157076 RepID=A0AB38A3Y8_9LACT|nr:hypothetical protein [Trichococcus collinsii]CZR10950.1 Hypothetical protein Tcol_3131 [Trichococcus collinsii]SEA95883.1 hypothetical protein SAMN04488525_11324 [Trichococcus collinsii]